MRKLITIILVLVASVAFSQTTYQLNYDSIRVGKTAGNGATSLYGKTYLKNATEGTPSDSVLTVRNGRVYKIAGSAISSVGFLTYVFSRDASDISGYEQMPALTSYTAGSADTATVAATTTPAIIQEFATNTGFPNTTLIPSGVFNVTYQTQKNSGSQSYYTYAVIYKRNLSGTETAIATTNNSSFVSANTVQSVSVSAVSPTDISVLTTDRIVVKVFAVMVSGTADISIYYDDATDSRLAFPSALVDASNFVPYNGAVKDLVSAFSITGDSIKRVGGTGAQFLMGNGTVQDTTTIQTVANFFPKGDTRYQRTSERTTVGNSFYTLTNPSAITFPRINANNTVSALSASDFRTAIGAGTSSTTGTVTSVSATAGTGISVTGSPITSSGNITITNTAPDQTVVLTAGTGISTSGTYPNFTITNTSPSPSGLQDSLTKKANRTFDNVASGAIANVKLANSTISGVALGSNLNALTLGNGLTGTSYNGSSAITARADTAVVQTVSNFFPKGDTRYAKTSDLTGYLPLTAGSGKSLTGDLYGTRGIFSTSSTSPVTVNSTGAGVFMPFSVSGSASGYVGSGAALFSGGSNDYMAISGASSKGLQLGTNNTVRYAIDASGNNTWTGAASFGATVAVTSSAANGARVSVNQAYNAGASSFGYDFYRTYDTGGANQLAGFIRVVRAGGDSNTGLSFAVANQGTSPTAQMTLAPSGTLSLTSLSGSGNVIAGANNSGEFGKITIGSGLSLSSGVLTATGGSSGSVTTPGGTSGKLAMFNSASDIGNSIMTESSGVISVSGALTSTGIMTASSFSGAGTGLTGTAASLTAGAANSVSWTNVSGRPTTVSSFTNDSGYITSSALAPYAPLNSPTFTGTPTLPTGTIAVTQTQGDNSTKIATTAYVDGLGGTILGAQKQIATTYTNISTSGTSEQSLFNHNIAQSNLSSDGDRIDFNFVGSFGLNGNDKYVRISVGGNLIPITGNASNKSVWEFEGYLMRTSSATYRIFIKSGVDYVYTSTVLDRTVTDFNPLNFQILGQTNSASFPVTVQMGYLQARKAP